MVASSCLGPKFEWTRPGVSDKREEVGRDGASLSLVSCDSVGTHRVSPTGSLGILLGVLQGLRGSLPFGDILSPLEVPTVGGLISFMGRSLPGFYQVSLV